MHNRANKSVLIQCKLNWLFSHLRLSYLEPAPLETKVVYSLLLCHWIGHDVL